MFEPIGTVILELVVLYRRDGRGGVLSWLMVLGLMSVVDFEMGWHVSIARRGGRRLAMPLEEGLLQDSLGMQSNFLSVEDGYMWLQTLTVVRWAMNLTVNWKGMRRHWLGVPDRIAKSSSIHHQMLMLPTLSHFHSFTAAV